MFNKLLAASMACLVLASVTASAYDRRMNVVNRSGKQVIGLWASNVGTNDWEEQILRAPLDHGESAMINFNDGTGYCRMDIRVRFYDGSYTYSRDGGVNVCDVSTFYINR